MMTLSCTSADCLTKVRIGRFLKNPVTRIGAFAFCPVCGGRASAHTDTDETYWETLARAYELPVEAVQAIHSIWDCNEYNRFSDFVNVMKKEAKIA
jgi:hypothetical protein